MDLLTYSSDELNSLRPDDYFFEPAERKIYQYRNKEGKAIIVREVGTSTITKLFKNVLKTVLKVDSDFDKYQVISIDTSLTLFNANIGETFEVGFGDASNVDEMKEAFNRGDEIVADIFDYDDIKVCIKLSVASTAVVSSEAEEKAEQGLSKDEQQRIKEIEEKKAKKRPFTSSGSSTKTTKAEPKKAKESPKKEAAPKKEPKTAPKEDKKEPKKEVKKETKEEKKAREKHEKEEQKAREKAEKEAQKAREKAEKEAKKKKK